ncbi:MAG: chemotaxis protein CheD [Phycisphaerae bacterium]
MQITVNISDAKASANPTDVLATYSLGSCIGVCLYDPVAHIAGMLHYQLPTASLDANRARDNPCMFADSGMVYLMEKITALGAQPKRIKVKIAGAAQMLNDGNLFNIGRRNHTAIRKILWQHGLFMEKEEIGGSAPRTLYMNVGDGSVLIKSNGTTSNL